MLFSYYFNTDKTHLLNCTFKVLQFTEKAAGVIEIMFSGEVAEWQHGIRVKRENKVATFSFPPTPEGQTKHDIDFTRVRYADQKKWIFTVINNKDANQKLEVGIISSTANKNPLGLDIYHDDDEFEVELKANTLSILEQSYVPPVLTQTVVSTDMAQVGYPERFSSATASYDSIAQNLTVQDFRQDFSDVIPSGSYFKMQLDIAPQSVNPAEGEILFDLTIPNLGRVSLFQTGFEYLLEGGVTSDIVRILVDTPVQVVDFYENYTMKSKSKMTIEGDGNGGLKVTYLGMTLTASYDHTKEFSLIEFRGAYAGGAIIPADMNKPEYGLPAKVDNILVTYRK